jgi:hypothetical protein
MTVDTRRTAYYRKLRVGDVIVEDDGKWLVTREPEVFSNWEVRVYLRPVPRDGKRSRAYVYGPFDRVKLA